MQIKKVTETFEAFNWRTPALVVVWTEKIDKKVFGANEETIEASNSRTQTLFSIGSGQLGIRGAKPITRASCNPLSVTVRPDHSKCSFVHNLNLLYFHKDVFY